MLAEQKTVRELTALCTRFRRELIALLHRVQTGHPGGSLSCCEIVTALYFHQLCVDADNPAWENRDRFVLSKGHAAPMLYLALAERGFFPKEALSGLRRCGSMLQGHPCAHKTPGVDCSAGPLGLGLSAALGMALAARQTHASYRVYALLGDGELQEGGVWEAAMAAGKFKPGNLTAIVDHNGVQLDGTNDEVMPLGDIAAKWRSFGWRVLSCDGHSIPALLHAFDNAQCGAQPVVILAQTVKGKGVSFMEGKSEWHGRPIDAEHCALALRELGGDV